MPIGKLPALRGDIDRNQGLLIEALRFSLEAASLSLNRVVAACREMEAGVNPENIALAFSILVDCWSVIDSVDRAREVVRHVRGIRRQFDWYKRFMNNTESVEVFRNIHQHIATHIPKLVNASPPVMGSLAWIDSSNPYRSFSVFVSGSSQEQSIPSLVVDTWTSGYAEDFVYSIDDKSVSLSNLAEEASLFAMAFEEHLRVQKMVGSGVVGLTLFQLDIRGMLQKSK